MEKDSGSWFLQQHLCPQSLNPNLFGFPFDIGQLTTEPARRNPYLIDNSTLGTVPLFQFHGLQLPKATEPNDSCNWLHSMPRSFQASTPMLNSVLAEKVPPVSLDLRQQGTPIKGTAPSQKRFLVIDQSGDKTTLMYSSLAEAGIKSGSCWMPEPPTTYNLSNEGLTDSIYPLKPIMSDEQEEGNSRDYTEDEMHEDTEELNALLCSDSEDYNSEEDEETSTGHSPSTIDNGIHDFVEETGEEVDSFSGSTKRQKLFDGVYDVPSHTAASSVKTHKCFALEDDAESSCGKRKRQNEDNLDYSLSGGKRSTKEKIRETVRILQSVIPNANGKDAIVVIDEAIHYLRSLKVKAKALGLDDALSVFLCSLPRQ